MRQLESNQIHTVFTGLGESSGGEEESDATGGEDENIGSGLELGGGDDVGKLSGSYSVADG
jgi:hypothetical protein